MQGFLIRTGIAAVGLAIAGSLIPGIQFDGSVTMLIAALLLGLVNAVVRPLAILLTALGQVDTPKSASVLLDVLRGDNPDLQKRAAVSLANQSAALPQVVSALAAAPEPQTAFFQLYTPRDKELAESLVTRAETVGYKAIVVTLDTWVTGWRPRDLNVSNFPQLRGHVLQNYFSDPRFRQMLGGKAPEDDLRTQPLVVGSTEVLDHPPRADRHEQRRGVRPPCGGRSAGARRPVRGVDVQLDRVHAPSSRITDHRTVGCRSVEEHYVATRLPEQQ